MKLKSRRLIAVVAVLVAVGVWLAVNPASYEQIFSVIENNGAEYSSEVDGSTGNEASALQSSENTGVDDGAPLAVNILELLEVKGRAPKTGYARTEFYNNWPTVDGCSLRQKIIKREFGESAVLDGCNVVAGEFDEPYTGKHLVYGIREDISKGIQIDHIVALSDAWQKGAQYMDEGTRYAMATDPLNLLAVDSSANQKKSDGDAATWLPPNKKFRCQYVARQVSVKYKYSLWVTEAEKNAISQVLQSCPSQQTIGIAQ
ncbi:HNH endonuclease [Candidatus Saccharibacteria bacterium]|nr:HNH endonuclease [Candidatus Saccharibacteria bacterium]